MLSWNAPLEPARISSTQFEIVSGDINNAPHEPIPPALATAIESETGGETSSEMARKEKCSQRTVFRILAGYSEDKASV